MIDYFYIPITTPIHEGRSTSILQCYKKHDIEFCDAVHAFWTQFQTQFKVLRLPATPRKHAKTRVMWEHINLNPYFVTKCASICSHVCHNLQCKKLQEAFAAPLFLQRCYMPVLPFIYSLHHKTHHCNVPAALQETPMWIEPKTLYTGRFPVAHSGI